ncbi:hypothetical protein B7494_g5482 [Chlorociboria aeruginascens]|nr:hypothetical protein B7494_g5482 [Chlorociboria aeruginascens]
MMSWSNAVQPPAGRASTTFKLPTTCNSTNTSKDPTNKTLKPACHAPAMPGSIFEPAHEFTLFSKLPVELRHKIWKEALPASPRVVKVLKLHGSQYMVGKDGKGVFKCKLKVACTIPVVLHVCQESRREALRVYTLAFSKNLDGRPVYFDFSRDELFLKDWHTVHAFDLGDWATGELTQQLRFLIIGGLRDARMGDFVADESLSNLWALEQVILEASWIHGLPVGPSEELVSATLNTQWKDKIKEHLGKHSKDILLPKVVFLSRKEIKAEVHKICVKASESSASMTLLTYRQKEYVKMVKPKASRRINKSFTYDDESASSFVFRLRKDSFYCQFKTFWAFEEAIGCRPILFDFGTFLVQLYNDFSQSIQID